MYRTCPKCGHTRDTGDDAPSDRCPACGLLYRKWLKNRFRRRDDDSGTPPAASRPRGAWVESLLAPPEDGRLAWAGRSALWLLLAWLGLQMAVTGYEDVVTQNASTAYWFMHRVDLVFHEAGHVVFRLFGEFMTVLGGSLLQLIMPLVVAGTFLVKHGNNFGATVGLWWTGQSLSDLAPYIADARELRLQLLGGGTGADRPGWHDWENILGRLDLLDQAKMLGGLADALGILLMALALLWAGVLLWRQHRWLSA